MCRHPPVATAPCPCMPPRQRTLRIRSTCAHDRQTRSAPNRVPTGLMQWIIGRLGLACHCPWLGEGASRKALIRVLLPDNNAFAVCATEAGRGGTRCRDRPARFRFPHFAMQSFCALYSSPVVVPPLSPSKDSNQREDCDAIFEHGSLLLAPPLVASVGAGAAWVGRPGLRRSWWRRCRRARRWIGIARRRERRGPAAVRCS